MLNRIALTALAAAVLCGAASAAETCGQWSAGMVEDEGGPVMMATTCTLHADMQSDLMVMCSGKDFYLRYLSGLVTDAPPSNTETGYQGEFEIAAGKDSVTEKMVYEEMDGAVTLSTPFDGPIAKMLKSGDTLSIKSKDGFFKPDTFALTGAAKALETLQGSCKE